MGKPILFDTISRAKFDQLDDGVKAKRNYQIKETDGTITKWIGGLEDKEGDKLPEVTSEDNGSVLTVVEGAWDKAEASGGSNDFLVTYTDNSGTITADKTFAEIRAAIEAGKIVRAKRDEYYFVLSVNINKYGENYIRFINVSLTGSGDGYEIIAYELQHNSNDTIDERYN